MSGSTLRQRATSPWVALALIFVGLFGATIAVSGLWAPLPVPKAGGTCGPGLGSEAAIAALVNPGSIGAGTEPATTRSAARSDWIQFVNDCQAATTRRALITIPVLVVSLILGVTGIVLIWKRFGRNEQAPSPPVDRWPSAFDAAPGPSPYYVASYPRTVGSVDPPGAVRPY